MTDYADLFEKNHPGVKVDNVFVPYDQMNSKLISAAGAQQGPDVAVFNGADASTLALGGALAPIDSEWSSFSDASQFPSSVIHKLDGKVYAVQGYVNLLGLWYNADILQKIGVQPPKTIDDLEAAMAAAKKAGYMGITLCGLPQSQGEWQAYPWLTSSGFSYDKPDAKALESGLSLVRDWVQKGYLSKAATTWDQTVPFQEFAAGKSAFAENGNWQMGTAASTAKFKYGVVPLPLGSSGKVYLGGEGEAVGAFSKHKDLAWQYLKETYFSAQGQLIALKDVGSIPSRDDAAKDPAVTNDELLKPFAETIAKMGANYPAEVVPPKSVADVELTLGQAWSSVLAGQTSPESAASKAVSTLKGLLQQ
ncbi:MAG TPA: extracellular solute-binding protein [Acidothermaceae bacterium]